jgi:hypothetical protein
LFNKAIHRNYERLKVPGVGGDVDGDETLSGSKSRSDKETKEKEDVDMVLSTAT